MAALTGQPAVDVAIGLFFVFFLLSVVCSAINETIATVLAWRSETLLAGLQSMLAEDADVPDRPKKTAPTAAIAPSQPTARSETADDPDLDSNRTRVMSAAVPDAPAAQPARPILPRLLDHPLIRSQIDETARNPLRRTVPSYLPPRTFVMALLDTLQGQRSEDNSIATVSDAIGRLRNPQVKGALEAVLKDSGGDIDRFRDGVETWFNATMARASGWYKRRTQLSLAVIAAAVTLAFNADAGQIATTLWKDPVLRASVAAQAQRAASEGDTSDLSGSGGDTLAAKVDQVNQLNLPLGWSFEKSDPRWPDDAAGFLGKILGLLATIAALSMGAPFWFDLLGRISRVRGSGSAAAPKPGR